MSVLDGHQARRVRASVFRILNAGASDRSAIGAARCGSLDRRPARRARAFLFQHAPKARASSVSTLQGASHLLSACAQSTTLLLSARAQKREPSFLGTRPKREPSFVSTRPKRELLVLIGVDDLLIGRVVEEVVHLRRLLHADLQHPALAE